MGGEEDGLAELSEPGNDLPGGAAGGRVETSGRLVQEDELGVADEGEGEIEPAPLFLISPGQPPIRAQSADLEHNLASSVPLSDPRQRLAGLAERQYRFGRRAEFAGIDKGGQLLKPRPAAVGSE